MLSIMYTFLHIQMTCRCLHVRYLFKEYVHECIYSVSSSFNTVDLMVADLDESAE